MIDTSAQGALKNSVYKLADFLLPILILVFFTPIIISNLGIKEYGIFIFLNTILTFLGLLDLGISTATDRHIVEYRSTNQIDRLKSLLYSMNSIYLIQATVYLIVCLIIGIIMQNFFIKPTTTENYFVLLSIIGVYGFISSIFTNFANITTSLQRYDINLKIRIGILLTSNISMLVLAVLGYKLVPILISQLIVSVLGVFVYYNTGKKLLPILKLKYEWNKLELKKNYLFAIPVAFNNVANSSLVHFDKLLIPIFLGGAPLTYYSVPGSIATKISNISATFSSLLFPITVNLHTLNNSEKIGRVYIRSMRLITVLSSAIAIPIILLADKILLYWLGEDFAEKATLVLILLVATNFLLALLSPLSSLLMAMGKMKFLTLSSLSMAILNIIFLILLLPKYGLNGAAWSYLISTLFVIWMFYYSQNKHFNIKKPFWFNLFIKIIITTIPFYLIIKFALYHLVTNFFSLSLIGPVCVLLFMLLYKTFGFLESEDWVDIREIIRKIRNQF